jgi:hypothetical protein
LNLQGIEYIWIIENLLRVPLGRNRARPSCTAHAWPTATRGAAQPGRPAQRASQGMSARDVHDSAARGGGASRRPNGGAPPAHRRRPRKQGAAHHRGDGGAAQWRRASGCGRLSDGPGRRRHQTAAVGTTAGGARRAARLSGRRREGRGRRSSAAHGSQSGLSAARHCH